MGISVKLLGVGARTSRVAITVASRACGRYPPFGRSAAVKSTRRKVVALYAAQAYPQRRTAPIDARRLAGHEVIGYDEALAAVPGAKWLEAHAADASVVLRSREMTDMVSAAAAGLGLAVLPCMLGEAEPALTRLTDDVLGSRKLSLVYRREMLRVAPVHAVIKFIAAVMRAHASLVSGIGASSSVPRKKVEGCG